MIFSILGKSKATSEGTASGNIGTETIRRWREVAAKLQTTMFPDSSSQDDSLPYDNSSTGPTAMGDYDLMSDEGPLFESISVKEAKPVQWPDPRAAVSLPTAPEEANYRGDFSGRTQQLSIDAQPTQTMSAIPGTANPRQTNHRQVAEQITVIDDIERIRIIAPSKELPEDSMELMEEERITANSSVRQQIAQQVRASAQTPHTRIMDSRGSNPTYTSISNSTAASKVAQFPPTKVSPMVSPQASSVLGNSGLGNTAPGNTGLTLEEDLRRRFGSNVKSALGPGTIIEGNFRFDSPVCIDGTLIGQVTSTSVLIVGENATVNATIKVGSLVVLGAVAGTVEAQDLVEIRAGGSLEGDIVTERIAIEDGGWFEGRVTPRIIMRGDTKGVIELENRTAAGDHHEVEMPNLVEDEDDLEF